MPESRIAIGCQTMAHVANVSGLYGYHSLVEELGGDADQLIRKVDLDPGGIECGICPTGQQARLR